MLTNALEVRALRETLRNEAIRTAVKDIDTWREQQSAAMITDLTNCITLLRRTKEMSQYGRSTSNYGTCKEHLMRYMIIMHMSPYDTYGSM